MKLLGIIFLTIGILSLIGGIIKPSGAIIQVVALGYFLKFALITGGVILISKSNKK